MRTHRYTARPLLGALALVVGLGARASAQQSDTSELDRHLATMRTASGEEYVAARVQLVGLGDAARATLEKRLQSATWTEASWNDLAVATIAHAHLAHPDVVSRVAKLEGLDPTHYLARRHPAPECARELKALGAHAVGPLLELYLKTFERYPFTTPATVPAAARGRKADDLAREERSALRQGIVTALAETRHPAALFVCKAVARDAAEDAAARLQAAEGLGTIGTKASLQELTALHADAATPAEVKLAALRGAARVPTADACAFLEGRLASGSADERHQAAVALGAFGSAHGWQARGAEMQKTGDALRLRAATKLVDAIRTADAQAPADALVDALGMIAHPDSVAALEAVANDARVSDANRAVAQQALERVKTAVARNSK